MNIHELLNMGGYGMYVWPAYCFTFLVFGINLIGLVREKKHVNKTIRELLATSHEQ